MFHVRPPLTVVLPPGQGRWEAIRWGERQADRLSQWTIGIGGTVTDGGPWGVSDNPTTIIRKEELLVVGARLLRYDCNRCADEHNFPTASGSNLSYNVWY